MLELDLSDLAAGYMESIHSFIRVSLPELCFEGVRSAAEASFTMIGQLASLQQSQTSALGHCYGLEPGPVQYSAARWANPLIYSTS